MAMTMTVTMDFNYQIGFVLNYFFV